MPVLVSVSPHHGHENGAVYRGYREKDLSLDCYT